MEATSCRSVLGAALIASSWWLCPAAANAVTLYDVTLGTSPAAVANPNVSSFTNCLAAEGCMGKGGLVDVAGGNLPDTLPFTFTLTAAQIASLAAPGLSGTLTVVASRDIGHKVGASADDFIAVTAEGLSFGSLFLNTIDTCPAGERGAAYSADLICGPNFHTDVTASDFLSLTGANLTTLAADGSVQFVFDPSNAVGRLKIFSVGLIITAIPEPGSLALFALGLAAIGLAKRTRR